MHILHNEKGQSAIEFILTSSFAIGITFLFLNQALNLTEGYLNHYVNFMSARAYLVHDEGVDSKLTNIAAAVTLAESVYESYPLESFGIISDFKVNTQEAASAIFTGTISSFEKRLSSLPMVGGSENALFYSEAFLGKEPSRFTCSEMVCAAISGSTTQCRSQAETMDIVLYDNGC